MRLFDDNKLNAAGEALDREIQVALAPILKRAKDAGYDHRDVGYIVITAANEQHLNIMLFGD